VPIQRKAQNKVPNTEPETKAARLGVAGGLDCRSRLALVRSHGSDDPCRLSSYGDYKLKGHQRELTPLELNAAALRLRSGLRFRRWLVNERRSL
jgi:hypothetical protein